MATGFAFTATSEPSPDARVREIHRRHAALAGQSHHEILGISPGGDRAAVRAAYHRMARRFHPDAQAGAPASLAAEIQAIFIRATEAYQALSAQSPRDGQPAPPPRAAHPVAPRSPRPRPRPAAAGGPGGPGSSGRPETRPAPSVDMVLDHAKERLVHGDAEGAVSLLHGVGSQVSGADRDRVQRLLARACILEPRWRRYALTQLYALLEQHPGDGEALALLGVLYHREGLLARAESTLRRALKAVPGQPDARAALQRLQKDREAEGVSNPTPDRKRPGLRSRFLGPRLAGGRHE